MLAEDGDDREHGRQPVAEQPPVARDGLRGEGGEHLLLHLRPEARERPQPLGLGGRAQPLERVDAELLPDPCRGLRPEPRQPHELDEPGRNLALLPRQCLDLAAVDDLDDLLLDRPADPLELLRAALERELRDRAARLPDPVRGPPVGEHAKGLGTVELHQVGEEVELGRDVRVARQRGRHRSIIGSGAHGPESRAIGRLPSSFGQRLVRVPYRIRQDRRPCAPSSACPPTTSARTSRRCCGPWASTACACS